MLGVPDKIKMSILFVAVYDFIEAEGRYYKYFFIFIFGTKCKTNAAIKYLYRFEAARMQ